MVAAVLLVAAAVVASCGGDDSAGGGPNDPAPSTPTTPPTTSVEAEVEAAYLAYWDMVTRLQSSPDPDSEEIPTRATGSVRDELTQGLEELQESNQRVEFGDLYEHHVLSISLQRDHAVLTDCFVDDAVTIQSRTSSTIRSGIVTGTLTVDLVLVDSNWLVAQVSVSSVSEGLNEC